MKSKDNIVVMASRDLKVWRKGYARREIKRFGMTFWPSIGDAVDTLRNQNSRRWKRMRFYCLREERLAPVWWFRDAQIETLQGP